jgi:uncharacterized membrane protein YukC
MVTLEDGSTVCSNCPEWAKECEAKRLLTYPIVDRMEGFREREKIRGKKSTDELKEIVESLRNKQSELRRNKAQKWLR